MVHFRPHFPKFPLHPGTPNPHICTAPNAPAGCSGARVCIRLASPFPLVDGSCLQLPAAPPRRPPFKRASPSAPIPVLQELLWSSCTRGFAVVNARRATRETVECAVCAHTLMGIRGEEEAETKGSILGPLKGKMKVLKKIKRRMGLGQF